MRAILSLFLGAVATGCAATNKRYTCLEIDHMFVFVSKGAPERSVLTNLGLKTDGRVARHVGQGTASIGFVFENAYLELLWVEDEEEFVRAETPKFIARANWRQTGASPFGVGLRNACRQTHPPCLPYEKSRGEWMQPGECIYILSHESDLREPEFFVVSPGIALPDWIEDYRARIPVDPRRISKAHFVVDPDAVYSKAAKLLIAEKTLELGPGSEPLLILHLTGPVEGQVADLRPNLPILIHY